MFFVSDFTNMELKFYHYVICDVYSSLIFYLLHMWYQYSDLPLLRYFIVWYSRRELVLFCYSNLLLAWLRYAIIRFCYVIWCCISYSTNCDVPISGQHLVYGALLFFERYTIFIFFYVILKFPINFLFL